ncbi:DUF6059 family protein [Kitasatospora sp. NPDC057198]|uniref:DUF6059 family protein n=1 Tax=Kitasatospora sp. NPDC057198 TaxID=3346046 RepID=UPI003642B172
MRKILWTALRRTVVALGWLGLFFSPSLHSLWLPGQDTFPFPAPEEEGEGEGEEEPAGPPPGHPDRRGMVRLSREECLAWAELNARLLK